jgi:hypothetical protein
MYFIRIKMKFDDAIKRPTLVAEIVATIIAPTASPIIPVKAPQNPYRKELVKFKTTPGPGLATVVAANNKNKRY